MPARSPDQPVYAVPEENLIPRSDHLSEMKEIPASRMFLIKKRLWFHTGNHHPKKHQFTKKKFQLLKKHRLKKFHYGIL